MKNKLFIIILFCSVNVFSQDYIKISGIVKDSISLEPVSGANIYLETHPIGTITNEIGEFEFNIPDSLSSDTVFITFVGYNSYKSLISEVVASEDSIFLLSPNVIEIEEVIALAEKTDPKEIISNVVKNLKNNYPRRQFLLDAFYRELSFSGDKYLRLIESAIEIQDFGFNSNFDRLRIKLVQMRKSYDYAEEKSLGELFLSKMFGDRNILYDTYRNDIVRFRKDYRVSIFKEKNYKNYEYNIEDIKLIDTSLVYIISYTPKNSDNILDYEGIMYVNKDDFSILKITLNAFFYRFDSGSKYFIDNKYIAKTSISYKKFGNLYFLNHIRQLEGITDAGIFGKDENGNKIAQLSCIDLYVNNVYFLRRNFDKIKMKEKEDRFSSLVDKNYNYDPKFWKNYNIVKINPLLERAKRDLQKEKNLEEQFKDNENN